jgi:hypothetical protein
VNGIIRKLPGICISCPVFIKIHKHTHTHSRIHTNTHL